MVHLANCLSCSVDEDKIASYVMELRRRGVKASSIKPMFEAAVDRGFLPHMFPSLDQLLSCRPRRQEEPLRGPTPGQEAEFRKGFQQFLETAKAHGIQIKSMPGTPKTRQQLEAERERQRKALAEHQAKSSPEPPRQGPRTSRGGGSA